MNKTFSIPAALLGVLLVLAGSAAAAPGPSGTTYYPSQEGEIIDPAYTTYPFLGEEVLDELIQLVWVDPDASLVDQTLVGDFAYEIHLTTYATGTFQVGAGTRAPDGTFSFAGWTFVTALGPGVLHYSGTIPTGTFTIPAGHKLVFTVMNTADAKQVAPPGATQAEKAAVHAYNTHRTLKIEVGSDDPGVAPLTSFTTSQPYSTAVPTPELSTVALMGAGLGLVGMAAVVRSRKN